MGEERLVANEAPAGSLSRQLLGWEACGFPRKLEPGLRRPRPSPRRPRENFRPRKGPKQS